MTETTLEKMARAMSVADVAHEHTSCTADYIPLARAALQAIREPDDAMLRAGMAGGWCDAEIAQIMHRAMIDAILNGEA